MMPKAELLLSFFDVLALLLTLGYSFVFFQIMHTFLPLRRNVLLRVAAFGVSWILSDTVIYSNDLPNLLGALLGFVVYIAVFHRGKLPQKVAAVLVFYPTVIAVNYLMRDIGMRIFFAVTDASSQVSSGRTKEQMMLDASINAFFLLIRLLCWLGAWRFVRRYLPQTVSNLTTKMWMVVNTLMLAPFVAIFIIIYFMPEDPLIVYPICVTSIFSSFGCIYLASYICNSVQTAYRAQELEMKQAYYRERMGDEERVRSVYHDLKNHLLLVEAQAAEGNGAGSQSLQKPIQALQEQIQAYENYYHTGNEFLDIIIRDKAVRAREQHIDFSAVIALEDGAFIDPLDISTIFGNALDNAIEAAGKLPEEQRLITVKAGRIRDMLVVTVENNADLEGYAADQTTKEDTFLHGFGLSNIRKAVEKYGGECQISTQEGKFVLRILVPVSD